MSVRTAPLLRLAAALTAPLLLLAAALAAPLLLLAAALVSCSSSGGDRDGLAARHPELAELKGHRLADTRPYYLPAGGRLTLFLCRWPDSAVIPVELPPDANADERRKLEAALAAWEGAGLGVRFAPSVGGLAGVGIEVRLRDDMLAYSANTIVDCAVDAAGIVDGADPLPARVVFASIHLAHGDPRLTGSALHELGHALGFQGHPRALRKLRTGRARPPSVMGRDTEAVRRAGESALAGKPFADPTLSALYALPSGTVLDRLPLAVEGTEPVDRMLRLGAKAGLIGPLVRVGDDEGRIAWLDPASGIAASLRLGSLNQARERPERLSIDPSARARRLLEADGS
jgi:hypothetical protein